MNIRTMSRNFGYSVTDMRLIDYSNIPLASVNVIINAMRYLAKYKDIS